MKKLIVRFLILLLVMCSLLACGCKKTNINLTNEQKQVYTEIETYAMSCTNNKEKEEVLYQIQLDIKKSSNNKLDIELSIGKLKIDKILLKQKLYDDIQQKTLEAKNNKNKYKKARDSIYNKYPGTYAQYNSEISALQNEISDAYGEYQVEVRRVNFMDNVIEGYKTSLLNNAQQKYQGVKNRCDAKIEQLKIQWNNKQRYDDYNELYNNVDLNLEIDILNLETKYRKDCTAIETKISNLISQR